MVKVGSDLYDSVYDSSDKAEIKAIDAQMQTHSEARVRQIDSLRAGSEFLDKLGYAALPLPAGDKAKHHVEPTAVKKRERIDLSKIGVDRSKLKRLSPNIPGARLFIDPDKRLIKAYYPGVEPATRQRTWGIATPRYKVLKHCLDWQWRHHLRLNPSAHCPFQWLLK